MTDFRISVEEIALEFEIQEMARNLIKEAIEEIEDIEKPSLLIIDEKIELPF